MNTPPEKRIEYRNQRPCIAGIRDRFNTAEDVRVFVGALNDLIDTHIDWGGRVRFDIEADPVEVCAACGNPYELIPDDGTFAEGVGLCAWGGADCSKKVTA